MTDNRSSIASRLSSYRYSLVLQEPEVFCDIASDRNQHLIDTNCKICLTKFNIQGISHTKKLYCSFCYRGVCTRCLANDYYHQEIKTYQPICSPCYDSVRVKTSNLHSDLENFRLERIELKKEINLAVQQREALSNDRKAIESEIVLFKEDLVIADIEKNVVIDKLKSQNQEIKTRIDHLTQLLESEKVKVFDLNKISLNLKQEVVEIKEREGENNRLKDFLLEYNSRIDRFRKEGKNSKSVSKNISNEIAGFGDKLEDTNKKCKQIGLILTEIKHRISRNRETIEKLYEKIESFKNKEINSFSSIEQLRLDELKNQIKELDDIIRLKEMRKNEQASKQVNYDYYKKLPFSSYPEIQAIEYRKHERAQRNCCSLF